MLAVSTNYCVHEVVQTAYYIFGLFITASEGECSLLAESGVCCAGVNYVL